MSGPLQPDAEPPVFAGLRVVELGSFVAAPAAATILGDHGADVVKVETPGDGDPWRVQWRRPGLPRSPHNFLWTLTSRNKRSVSLDLKHPDGRAAFDRLIASADVFVTNLPLAARERLGTGHPRLAGLNPRLVYASLTGFGEDGAEKHDKGFDATVWWARSGLMDQVRADADTEPARGVSAMGDHNTALALYGAIAAALYRRERTGRGSYVRSSLIANGAWTNGSLLQAALFGAAFEPVPPRACAPNPLQNQYRCADGRWIIVIVSIEQQARNWPKLAALLGMPELPQDPRFATAQDCQRNNTALVALLDAAFARRPAAEWKALLAREGLPSGIAARPEDVPGDPQFRAAGAIVPLDGVDGAGWTVSSPFEVDGAPKRPAGPPPQLGEHTDAVLRELGYAADEISALRAAGAAG